MQDILTMLTNLQRPRLLIRAARFGQKDYSRGRDLRRILKTQATYGPGRAIIELVGVETQHEDKRKSGDASYSIARHIEVLIALMAEAKLLAARQST